ncbi:phosphatidylserine decarboxylase family protein [Roseibium algae]|uniref:Phosphatidylserine decarboxylase family protein n=1 Tax=Roseibium algae TaxID=3123038 RepID=A0ABU8TL64_9HYPH
MTISNPYRVGEWLPSDQAVLDAWISDQILASEAQPRKLLPVIQEFQAFIEEDAAVFMLFSQMFTEVHQTKNPTGKPQVKDYKQFLRLLNHIMTHAPRFNETGLVGFPINALLDWSMGTASGFAAFLRSDINAQLQIVLDEWARFLGSPDSVHVLVDKPWGWLGEAAFKSLAPPGTQNPRQYFIENFNCDPYAPHFGFTSWDDFFTRTFRPGARPVDGPNHNRIINNACESAPYRIARNVSRKDQFWIKGQPYSLEHMLDHDPLLEHFIGGTIYQAFLSASSFHRWHSPVNGQIIKAYNIDGTYYSESLMNRHDPAGPNNSQGYITSVAARAPIFIQADNPDIGLMCVMPVGMAEVSTNQITVYEGQQVKKGDQLGMFHFGGSTHCMFFRPETRLKFHLDEEPGLNSQNLLVNSKLATVEKNSPDIAVD